MGLAFTIFWISLLILFFSYIGYGILLFLLNGIKQLFRKPTPDTALAEWPGLTMIIAAYNEGQVLRSKLDNTLAIDYPSHQFSIIVVTDGSTDGSEQLLYDSPQVRILHHPQRQGKLAALTRAMQEVKTEYVVFSDANSMLNPESLKKMMIHYSDPRTGGVAGEKKIVSRDGPAIGEAEGLYWRYESFMKKLDAGFYTVVAAAGELFSIRTQLFQPPAQGLLLDDFVISMRICLQGYRMQYEPGAFATEFPSTSLAEETKRKVRIAAGAYQSIGYLRQALNPFRYPLLWFQYVSRRLLRWIVCPWMLLVLLAVNLFIVTRDHTPVFYTWFFYAQLLFYAIALLGGLFMGRVRHIGIMTIPFYFLFMNYCMIRGCFRFLRKKQTVLWEKAVRKE